MARSFLPILSEVHEHTYDAALSGVAVRCTMTWLERPASWYLDIATTDGTQIVKGRRISAGRTPLEGLRLLHLIGDLQRVIPIGPDPYPQRDPPIVTVIDRVAATVEDFGLSVVAGDQT